MPKISVIIPAYNAEKTIKETIESVQQQTFTDFELIVINDGSQDKTLEILHTIKDERLQIFSYENGGLPEARNRGIKRASGEFVSFLDADDLWTPDKLELQLVALQQNPDAGVAYSWNLCMFEKEGTLSFVNAASPPFEGNVYPNLLLENFVGNGSNILLRRQVIESVGNFDRTLKSFEDWEFYLRVASVWNFVLIPQRQIIYRKVSSSMTSKVKVMEEQGLRLIEKVYRSVPPELQYLKNQTLANFYSFCADLNLNVIYNTNDNRGFQAQRKLYLAIQLYPKILLRKNIQGLIVKSIIRQVIPARITTYLMQSIIKIGSNTVSR
ncbi:glycosyltransferase [Nostoc sp. FACHB-892]|uniref:glycosyltransferase family 2 protein n=1 Tax=Nostoc sp. FACHB-892 TaxID=2692843 RepID=UPI001686C727|nr:glycosyltransferase family 2 protein [Nostoc sp. FACHB-892]MBD2730343.1 glycosyltransferase [Nostoc sp. FACHB-892]